MLPARAYSQFILRSALLALVPPASAQTLAITGATIIDGTGKAPLSDGVLLITGGRIAAIGHSVDVAIPSAARRLDARGKYLIPGGVDVHVHVELPFCGTTSSDDWETGTRAAARGGVTTVMKALLVSRGAWPTMFVIATL